MDATHNHVGPAGDGGKFEMRILNYSHPYETGTCCCYNKMASRLLYKINIKIRGRSLTEKLSFFRRVKANKLRSRTTRTSGPARAATLRSLKQKENETEGRRKTLKSFRHESLKVVAGGQGRERGRGRGTRPGGGRARAARARRLATGGLGRTNLRTAPRGGLRLHGLALL
ncbi:hypothetical protein EVAR_21802_1 [Eumeta japonica]|uniref:Uncharacterized protein n=1 Tax=Eumeta variegata TaxID=151549 RepID=A0A4C1YG44_EUMVA|nr:hypothetical protein EVAR_21802_1 [Eumeta japonica]